MKRRDFLNQASLLTAGTGLVSTLPLQLLAMPKANTPHSDTVNFGVIGLNGMGWFNLNVMRGLPGVKCTAICDVDQPLMDRRAAELTKENITVKKYSDYRKLLEDKDIDVVVIGTPDHWHCLMMVEAVQAGKHVYLEKPVGNSIAECEIMVKAKDRYNKTVQIGQWQRSMQHFTDAVNFVQSGKLGKIRSVKSWAYIGWANELVKKPDSPVPSGVDYDRWLGPARKRPFNIYRFHSHFRYFWDYGGGMMTDFGVHMVDFAMIGMNAGIPKSILSTGGKFGFPDDAQETPDTMTTLFEYDDYFIQWEQSMGIAGGPYGLDHGIAFLGNKGTLVVNREGWQVIPETKNNVPLMEGMPLIKPTDSAVEKHCQNFIDAVRTGDSSGLRAPIEAGARIAKIAHMGNIAYLTGEKLMWDENKKQFSNRNANKLITPGYHNGYKLPQV